MSKGSTLVSIRLNGVPDNDTHGLIVLGLDGSKPIEMNWLDSKHLGISCPSCKSTDVNFEVVKTGDITIIYGDNLRSE